MNIKPITASLCLMISCASAHATGAGDNLINVGWAHLDPHDTSEPLTVTAQGKTATKPGSGSSIENTNTGFMAFTHFFTDHIGAETALGAPPTLHLKGEGSTAALGELATAKANSPLVEALYYFGEKDQSFRPFLGAGVTYVWFNDIKLSQNIASGKFLASPTTGNALVGPTTAKIDSGFYPIATAGFSYQFNKNWSTRLSATYIPLKLDATLTTQAPAGTVVTSSKGSLNAVVSFLSVGYTF